MKETKITCDGCGKDLTTTGNSVDYRLALVNEAIPSGGGAVTDMMVYPPIERNVHFCGMRCLKAWLSAPPNGRTD